MSVFSRARNFLGSLITPKATPTTDGAQATADFGGGYLAAAGLRNRFRSPSLTQDPRRQNTWENRPPYDDARLASIGRNGVARRCISTRVLDAVRPGWTTDFPTLDKGQAKEVSADLENYHRELTTKQKLKRALVWSEQYGHSICVMGVDDKGSLAAPINEADIQTIHWLKVFNRTRYQIGDLSDGVTPEADGTVRAPGLPQWFEIQDMSEPEVEAYRFNSGTTASSATTTRVHWSRVLGPFHTEDGHSRLDEYGEALEDFFTTHDSAERLAATMSIANMEIEGWNARCAQDEPNARARVEIFAEGLSTGNVAITDKTEEKLTYTSRSATGLDGIMDRKQVLLCATTGLSNMKLFGVDPAGFSSGAEVVDDYNTTVHAVFEDQIEPELRRLNNLILKAKDGPTQGAGAPDVFVIRQNPLRLPSPTEATENKIKTWKAVAEITGEPILDRREARESLFGADAANDATPTITLAPADTQQETPPQVEVGVAQGILAAAVDPTLSPDQKRAIILALSPQIPEALLLRIAPDAPAADPLAADAGPTDADALAAEPEQWKTADEISAAFGSVTAAQIKAHRCPAKGAEITQPDPRQPAQQGLRWIKPGAKPLYRLSEVRAMFEGGGPDLDPATPDLENKSPGAGIDPPAPATP